MHPLPTDRIRATLIEAEAKRKRALGDRVIDAWRILNGLGDGGPPGLTIDRYGAWLVIAAREQLGEEITDAWTKAALALFPHEGAVLKRLRRSVKESTSEVIRGRSPAGIRVREEDAVFSCDLDDGISTGLFLDQREARLRIRPFAKDREVLNLFAYTCAFSVHAALGGAARVTSVDVSRKSLRRGRENMQASGLDPDRHRWFDDDAFLFLARQRRKGGAYGLVIADPPVFGRSRGGAFSLERDLGALLEGCVAATQNGGVLVFSTHLLSLDEARLVAAAEGAARAVSRSIAAVETLGLPEWDHPAPPRGSTVEPGAEDRGNYLKTLVLRVG